jgi:hypothetical protein
MASGTKLQFIRGHFDFHSGRHGEEMVSRRMHLCSQVHNVPVFFLFKNMITADPLRL